MFPNFHVPITMTNFKYFSPLQRLNKGLFQTNISEGETKINPFGGRRYHRFAACNESFTDNLLGLNCNLRRIGEHYQLTYKKEDRLNAAKFKPIQNTILLSIDLEAFFLKMKELLDCIAFFVPFYYGNSFQRKEDGLQKDVRDFNRPWSFRTMINFINGKTSDRVFKEILTNNDDWIEDVLCKRDILCHKFHRLSVSQDYWTNSCYAYLYEFNKRRDFIPDVLSYVSVIYFKSVKFLEAIEIHFRDTCEREIAGYQYFNEGSSFANKMDKVHYFFASFGRFLDGKILIRIHPEMRNEIEKWLNQALTDLNIRCSKCKKSIIKVKPTVENFVLITAHCNCGNTIYLRSSVSKRFFPHFFDRNQNYWDLVPVYKLEEKTTF